MTEIKLIIDVEEVRSIYLDNGHQKMFFGRHTKRQSLYMTISLVLYPFFAYWAINLDDSWMFTLGTIFVSLMIYDFVRVVKPIYVWKKGVDKYLVECTSIKDLRIKYDDNSFWHIQDNDVVKADWAIIESAVVNNKLVLLSTSKSNYLFPKKSMNQSEFDGLSQIVMEKVQHVQKNDSLDKPY
jgi:hypothetical protein